MREGRREREGKEEGGKREGGKERKRREGGGMEGREREGKGKGVEEGVQVHVHVSGIIYDSCTCSLADIAVIIVCLVV